jgi:hypothetical protein
MIADEADHPNFDKRYCFVQVVGTRAENYRVRRFRSRECAGRRKSRNAAIAGSPWPMHFGQVELARDWRSSHAQGIPFKSGALSNCFGKPPAMHINAMTSTPANPPPMNAAITHQNEIIRPPLSLTTDKNRVP